MNYHYIEKSTILHSDWIIISENKSSIYLRFSLSETAPYILSQNFLMAFEFIRGSSPIFDILRIYICIMKRK